MDSTDNEERWFSGACHCAAVRFEVRFDAWEGIRCNCSVCHKTGFEHLIVSLSHFRLRAGEEALTTYRFNTGTAKHTFCSVCGVKPFYTPRSHPDGVSVNIRCLDDLEAQARFTLTEFDGRRWEDHVEEIR